MPDPAPTVIDPIINSSRPNQVRVPPNAYIVPEDVPGNLQRLFSADRQLQIQREELKTGETFRDALKWPESFVPLRTKVKSGWFAIDFALDQFIEADKKRLIKANELVIQELESLHQALPAELLKGPPEKGGGVKTAIEKGSQIAKWISIARIVAGDDISVELALELKGRFIQDEAIANLKAEDLKDPKNKAIILEKIATAVLLEGADSLKQPNDTAGDKPKAMIVDMSFRDP